MSVPICVGCAELYLTRVYYFVFFAKPSERPRHTLTRLLPPTTCNQQQTREEPEECRPQPFTPNCNLNRNKPLSTPRQSLPRCLCVPYGTTSTIIKVQMVLQTATVAVDRVVVRVEYSFAANSHRSSLHRHTIRTMILLVIHRMLMLKLAMVSFSACAL